MLSRDYEKSSYKELGFRFGWQFSLFVICVLVTSAIFFGIEKHYPHDELIEHHPDYDEELNYLIQHSSVDAFAKKHNISKNAVHQFIRNLSQVVYEYYTKDRHIDMAGEENHDHDLSHYENFDMHGMSFLEAFVLTVSIVSTIGWGHVTPVTSGGKAFSVLVALLGIPLTFIMIISGCHLYMKGVKNILWKCVAKVMGPNEDRISERVNLIFKYLLVFLFLIFMFITSAIIAKLEGYHYVDGLWFAFMAVTTVGFGDVVMNQVFVYEHMAKTSGLAIFMLIWIVAAFVILGSVILGFMYNFNRNMALENQFYKKNEIDLVEDTDDPVFTGGNVIYTGGD